MRVWISALVLTSAVLLHGDARMAPRFYPDDPIQVEPAAHEARAAVRRDVLLSWDALYHLFVRHGPSRVRAIDANTVAEVPDSDWYVNRNPAALPDDVLAAGPNVDPPPAPPLTVISGKADGFTPGMVARDAAGVVWFIKFDSPRHPELASSAEVISTHLLWALGYHVPQNRVAVIRPEELRLDARASMRSAGERRRPMRTHDLDRLLRGVARRADGSYRVLASRGIDGRILGPFLYSGTRADDPNDVIPHEHRRSLRALRVFAAWLNHVDTKSINTLDTIVERDGRRVIRHYLIDFGSTLGSDGAGFRSVEEGHQYLFDLRDLARSLFTLGLAVPHWRQVASGPPSAGRFDSATFDPATWKPRIPNPAFGQAMADDLFWGASKLAALDRRAIASAVAAASMSDPAAADYLAKTLRERRRRILLAWLPGVTPLVDLRLDDANRLHFVNAAVEADVARRPARYSTRWFAFDNDSGLSTLLGERTVVGSPVEPPGPMAPAAGEYLRIDVTLIGPAPRHGRFYFRHDGVSWSLVGLERLAAGASS